MKRDLTYIIIILLLIGGGFAAKKWYDNKLEEKDIAYKELVLERDTLKQVSETQATKLVDDTKTIKELEEEVKDLGIKLDEKPKVITKIKYVFKEVEKPTDSITIENDTLTVKDYYPNKENPFIEYETEIDLNTNLGNSKWNFNPIDIAITLSQRDDGIWKSDIKKPEFITINDFEIIATPLDIPKLDNFGWLLGAGYGKDFRTDSNFIRVSGGLRYKKIYLDLGASSNENVDLGIKFEF